MHEAASRAANAKLLDKKQVEHFKAVLLKEKRRLEDELRHIETTMELSQNEWGGENSYEDHMADIGSSTYARESDLSLERNAKDLLARVNEALKRIDQGTYGICVRCGRPIELNRLRALPWADLDIEHKKEEEKSW